MRRIATLIRDNVAQLRQVESVAREQEHRPGKAAALRKPDPILDQIAGQFTRFDVEKSRGGYLIWDRRRADPIARLRPIPGTDRFELFYWSNTHRRWRTFGNFGRMKLMLQSAREIVENDPMFRVPRSR
jgi:hypothetical protein